MPGRLGLGFRLNERRRALAGSGPPPASGPLLGPQSIEFAPRNGRGQRVWLQATHPTQMFRTGGTTFASGVVICRVQIDIAAMRGAGNLGGNTAGNLQGNSFIFGNGTGTGSSCGLIYFGREHTTVAYRERFVFHCNQSGNSFFALSPLHTTNARVTVIGEVDAPNTQARCGLMYDTGAIDWGAWVSTGTFVGITQATPPALRIGSDTSATADSISGRAKGTRFADWTYVRSLDGSLPDPAIYARFQAGEAADAIWSIPALDAWWRLSGMSDLAQTGGAGSYGAMSAQKAGTYDDVDIMSGPSIGARKAGGLGLSILLPRDPCIIGVPPTALTQAQSIPFSLTNTSDSTASHVEVRAVRTSDRTTGWTPWVRVTSTPLAAGATVSTSLPNVAPSPELYLEARLEADNNIRAVSGPCGVAPIFVLQGPSTVQRPVTRMPDAPIVDAAAWADTLPAKNTSTCYFACIHSIAGLYGSVVYEKIVMRSQFGLGATAFARLWSERNPDRLAVVLDNSYAGSGLNEWYNDTVIPSAPSGYRHFGDWTTPNSGYVTDVLLRVFPTVTERRITCWLVKLGAQDMPVASQAAVRMNVLFNGANRTGDGIGNQASPGDRHWLQPASGLPWAPRLIFWQLPRSYSNDNTTLAEVQADQAQLLNWRNSYEFCMANMDAPLLANTIRAVHIPTVTPESVTDRLHHGSNGTSGVARWFAHWAVQASQYIGSVTDYVQPNPPSTFSINPARDTITVTLPAITGSWALQGGGTTVNGWNITIDGGTTWTHIQGTLSGNTVTFSGSWAAVSDANLRLWHDRDGLPAVINADPAITFADDVAARAFFLVETRSYLSGPLTPGIPLNRNTAPMTPA